MSLFRDRAVRQYDNPDEKGGLLRVAPPSGLRVFLPLAAFFVIAVAIASVQKVHETARGRGVIRPAAGIHVLRAPAAGRVAEVLVATGDEVEAGAPLLRLDEMVQAPVGGRVDAVGVRAGERVAAGAPLVKIVPTDGALVGLLTIGAEHRSHLRAGDPVRLRLDEHRAQEAGFGQATIVRVSDDPVSAELLDPLLAQAIAGESSVAFLVELRPDAMPPRAPGGFRNGMTFTGEVVLRERRIISLLLDL